MKKAFFFALALSTMLAQNAQAESSVHPLEVNRSLLARFEAEFVKLKREEAANPTDSMKRKLLGAKYKVKALRDEAARLRSSLPEQKAAEEYLKDFVAARSMIKRSQITAPAPKPVVAPLPSRVRSSAAMHEEALWYVSQKKFSDAIRAYEDIVLAYPEDDEAYMLLGHTCLLSGEYAKAEYAFASAVRIEPRNLSEILPFYQGLILQDPDDDVAHACLGYALLILEDYAGAGQAFQDALDINPENREATQGLNIAADMRLGT